MLNRLGPVLCCAAWMAVSAALAEPARARDPAASPTAPSSADRTGETTVGEVVVPGRALTTPQTFAKSVEKFVHDLGRPGPFGQISRWRRPVCPKATGLSPAFNGFVVRRIREIAARVGAPATGECRQGANVLVVFTTEPERLMADVREHHEGLLGYHFVGETKSLAAFEAPMKSWYVTMTAVEGRDGAMFDVAYLPGPPGGTGSRIHVRLKSEFAFVLVVVDSELLEGQPIGPVTDRIAMLALSKPAPRTGCSSLPSVMDVLDPLCPSRASTEGLTPYDEDYLKALYAYAGSEERAFERGAIAKRMVKDLRPAPPGRGGP